MILGIDIGGTKCAAIVADETGAMIDRRQMDTLSAQGPGVVLSRLIELSKSLWTSANHSTAFPVAIGISCGGPLDSRNGIVHDPPNLPGWSDIPVRKMFEDAFPGSRVVLENDANATAMAEWKFGAGRGVQSMVFMTLGTGIGAGLILDGRLYRGANDLAGEVGHQTILRNGPRCKCGKLGCLEALASGPSIANLAQESLDYGRGKALVDLAGGKSSMITARHIIEAAKCGDAFSIGILKEAGTYLGIGIANIVQILNPERIVLGTLAVHAGDLLLEPVRSAVSEYAWSRSTNGLTIVPAELGDVAQDMAAIVLAL